MADWRWRVAVLVLRPENVSEGPSLFQLSNSGLFLSTAGFNANHSSHYQALICWRRTNKRAFFFFYFLCRMRRTSPDILLANFGPHDNSYVERTLGNCKVTRGRGWTLSRKSTLIHCCHSQNKASVGLEWRTWLLIRKPVVSAREMFSQGERRAKIPLQKFPSGRRQKPRWLLIK